MKSNKVLQSLKSIGTVNSWIRISDLEMNKAYKIIAVKRAASKFNIDKMQTIITLKDGYLLSLPTRFDDLSEEMFEYLQTGVSIVNKGAIGKTWILDFTTE